jgi:hypothetical protein
MEKEVGKRMVTMFAKVWERTWEREIGNGKEVGRGWGKRLARSWEGGRNECCLARRRGQEEEGGGVR